MSPVASGDSLQDTDIKWQKVLIILRKDALRAVCKDKGEIKYFSLVGDQVTRGLSIIYSARFAF